MKKALFLLLTLCAQAAFANDVQVSSITLTGDVPNGRPSYTNVQFNLSWKNSWRDAGAPSLSANWDAVWLFVKFKDESGFYRHATLSATASHHNGQGFTVAPAPDGKGVFVHRSAAGTGDVSLNNVQLRWNYGLDMTVPISAVTVQVFAVEMVYIPQGGFALGDSSSAFVNAQFSKGGTIEPFPITSEGELTLGGVVPANLANRNNVGSGSDDFNNTTTRVLPAAFPKGFRAFYCMKYELTFGQMADFYNNLTAQQVTNLGGATANLAGNRTATFSGTHPNIVANRPDRAISYSSYSSIPRAILYCAWAGLRPMTELEFEKACRGAERGFPDEYAWGNPSIVAATALSGTEDGTETVTTAQANANYGGTTLVGGDGGSGTLRAGIFAKNGTGRAQAGASFYGVMDLSGNVEEGCITVGGSVGRAFTGIHGSGAITPASLLSGAEATDWSMVTQSGGVMARGGAYNSTSTAIDLRVSNRRYIFPYNYRGARTAP